MWTRQYPHRTDPQIIVVDPSRHRGVLGTNLQRALHPREAFAGGRGSSRVEMFDIGLRRHIRLAAGDELPDTLPIRAGSCEIALQPPNIAAL